MRGVRKFHPTAVHCCLLTSQHWTNRLIILGSSFLAGNKGNNWICLQCSSVLRWLRCSSTHYIRVKGLATLRVEWNTEVCLIWSSFTGGNREVKAARKFSQKLPTITKSCHIASESVLLWEPQFRETFSQIFATREKGPGEDSVILRWAFVLCPM